MTGIHQMLAAGAPPSKSLIGIIQSQGLSSGLIYSLDAGDISSYSGSGQVWTDLSGNSNNYNRGLSSSSEATVDPTFNGSAGALDETNYWTNPATGVFTIATSPTTFDDGWAKDNGALTLIYVFLKAASTPLAALGGNLTSNVSNGGCALVVTGINVLRYNYNINDSATGGSTFFTSSASFSSDVIQFAALAFDEATTSGILQINSTQETSSALSACTGVNNPPKDWRIGDDGLGDWMPTRLYAAAAWSTKLTTTQLSNLYTALKTNRFTSLP